MTWLSCSSLLITLSHQLSNKSKKDNCSLELIAVKHLDSLNINDDDDDHHDHESDNTIKTNSQEQSSSCSSTSTLTNTCTDLITNTTTSTTTTTTITKKEEKKKKKKNERITKKKKIGFIEPGTIVEGVNDEQNFHYHYGPVVNVKGVDTSKPWTEEILGQYLKDAGFVRGSASSASKKAQITPNFIQFSDKLGQIICCVNGICNSHPFKRLKLTGNGKIDLENALSAIGSFELFEKTQPRLPPSYTTMTTLFVVAAYIMGLPGFGAGPLPNIVKHTLVKMNSEIPRGGHYLLVKIHYSLNLFYAEVDQHYDVVWDQSMLTKFLLGNNESIESALQEMGRAILPFWDSDEGWSENLSQALFMATLLAFQTGINNYVYPPSINSCLKTFILRHLEFPVFDYDDDPSVPHSQILSLLL
ncbi:hypothetical protein DFA_11199 [Cavenderia fasciculata]|uniref:Uncharacterized protein n=1 Tax=Cavenderia fasciculata TaxID=261658 RepID=F4QFD1_CACFS|nr:uncharacterized protein DFA_11199 [Cavenderia fasciculata]EGG13438.1 hypothetical protein DFA_11199 [Cavenderia fasciculata]|eukprot:XP_004350142.1 hypothetical protein DFA_11199 [Cavenderia fasciculata]